MALRLILCTSVLHADHPLGATPLPTQQASPGQIERWKQECNQKLERGEYQQALPACQHVVDALEQKIPEHPDFAAAVGDLGELFYHQGSLKNAESLYRRSLAIREKVLSSNHPDIAESLNNLALLYKAQGAYAQAEPLLRRSLAILEKALGPNHPDVATSLNNLALLYQAQGAYAQAEPLYRRSLDIREKVLGPNHPDMATSLNNLAQLYRAQGDYVQAEPLLRRSLAISEKALGPNHPNVATSLNNLALLYQDQGAYAQAEPLLRRSLAIWEKAHGPSHPDVAICLHNLASLYQDQGAYAQAEQLYSRSLAISEKALGPNHPDVAIRLHNLAWLYQEQGAYAQAEPLLRRSLAIREKALSPNHPYVAESLDNLALFYQGQGAYAQAEPFLRRSLAISEKALGPNHPDVATSLNNLALLYQAQGAYAQAEPFLRRSLAIREKAFGPNHPDVARSLNNLAILAVAQLRFASALALLAQGLSTREYTLRQATTEARVSALLNQMRTEEDQIYSLLDAHPSPAVFPLVLQALLLRKGRAAEAGAWANFALHRSLLSSDMQTLYYQWQSTRQQHESLLYKGPGKLAPEEHQNRLRDLNLHADQLEHQLVAELPLLKQLQPPLPDRILSEVAAKLPPDGALLELVLFKPYHFQARGKQERWAKPHYLALLLFPEQDIEVVDLGEAATVDSRIVDLLTALQNPQLDPVRPAQILYQRFFADLRDHMQGIRHLYVSPDGLFNFVPFAALHDGRDYLLGQYRFHYLTAGRDLLREPVVDPKHPPQKPLILADPDFQATLMASPAGEAGAQPGLSKGLYAQFKEIPRLPGTRAEAKGIERVLGVASLLGAQATEAAVLKTQAPVILHLATHGVLVEDAQQGARLMASSRGLGRTLVTVDRESVESQPSGKPDASQLSRSVLLLAGAEHGDTASDSAHDGLLTAEEVRSLNLWGTQLVVLSACDTGKGALASGQGVYGLRRSFLVAGAETLVTSLWPVSDEATGELMVSYYQKLVKEKKGRVEAMEEAMEEMKQRRPHPYYWAPFIVIGQDGPLRMPPSFSQSHG
jgi:CHAT domain-containing protein/tetratricopeptide (TPR) repeat protein